MEKPPPVLLVAWSQQTKKLPTELFQPGALLFSGKVKLFLPGFLPV